ncbi:hypothetical protein [Amycolatopsis benzoatilytica]|uniref:hypothetical protein n=1 Tax=Amycolatopsis benzoatilytica TaxID=346045 RepID=UPI000380EB08|nr:hypothetical protein [Amycolatopsis benzoatilytica]
MAKLTDRLREPLSSTDKRVVTVVAAVFVVAFALVNYGTVRSATRGCVEAGHGTPIVPGDGGAIQAATVRVCPGEAGPTGSEIALSMGATLPNIVFSALALLLLCRFLWGAARPGLHSPVTPGRLRTLGWFVLVAGPVAAALQYWFQYELAAALLRTPQRQPDFNGQYHAWLQELQMDFPWWCVFAGVAALVVAKLLRIEVRLAEDLEGTI